MDTPRREDYDSRSRRAAWPSGKARDCKSLIPSSILGAASNLRLGVLASAGGQTRLSQSGSGLRSAAAQALGSGEDQPAQDVSHSALRGDSWVRVSQRSQVDVATERDQAEAEQCTRKCMPARWLTAERPTAEQNRPA